MDPAAKPPAAIPTPAATKPGALTIDSDLPEVKRKRAVSTPEKGDVFDYRASLNRDIAGLSEKQKGAIKAFTNKYDTTIRAIDRGIPDERILEQINKFVKAGGELNEGSAAEHLAAAREYHKNLYAAMAKMKARPMTVFRGIGGLSKEAVENILNTDVMGQDAVGSSSRSQIVAEKFMRDNRTGAKNAFGIMFRIKQKSAVGIETISDFGQEMELLLPKGLNYKVISKGIYGNKIPGGNNWIIDLEEI